MSGSARSKRVRINVGGTIFETSALTMTRIPNTVLSTLVEERWTNGSGTSSQDGEIFIDRDPTHFPRILNFLRDGDEFVMPKENAVIAEIQREATFYQITPLAELCTQQLLPPGENDLVEWHPDAIALYWRPFIRYMVDDSLTLPFIYDRNNHTLARCFACEEYQDPKNSYIFDINYPDWEALKQHMQYMTGQVTQVMGEVCCVVAWDNGQTIHLPRSALRKIPSLQIQQ